MMLFGIVGVANGFKYRSIGEDLMRGLFPTSSEKWLASQYFLGIVSVSMFHSSYDETLKLQSCLGQGAITSNKTGYTCDDLGGSKSQIQKRAMLFKNF